MGTYKIKPNIQIYSRVNFPACIKLTSDWFKNNQLLSDSHMHNIVNLSLQMPQRLPRRGGEGGGWGGCWLVKFKIDWRLILQQQKSLYKYREQHFTVTHLTTVKKYFTCVITCSICLFRWRPSQQFFGRSMNRKQRMVLKI